jgi:hypothetical protein
MRKMTRFSPLKCWLRRYRIGREAICVYVCRCDGQRTEGVGVKLRMWVVGIAGGLKWVMTAEEGKA